MLGSDAAARKKLTEEERKEAECKKAHDDSEIETGTANRKRKKPSRYSDSESSKSEDGAMKALTNLVMIISFK